MISSISSTSNFPASDSFSRSTAVVYGESALCFGKILSTPWGELYALRRALYLGEVYEPIQR